MTYCSRCSQQLLAMPLVPQQKTAHLCDNFACTLFAWPAYYTDNGATPDPRQSQTPYAKAYQRRRNANYRLLRDNGAGSVEASRNTSDRATDALLARMNLTRKDGNDYGE